MTESAIILKERSRWLKSSNSNPSNDFLEGVLRSFSYFIVEDLKSSLITSYLIDEEELNEFRPDAKCFLWTDDVEYFFRDIQINHRYYESSISNICSHVNALIKM